MPVEKRSGSPFWYMRFQLEGRRVFRSTGARGRREAEEVERRERRRLEEEFAATKAGKLGPTTWGAAVLRYWVEVGCHQAAAKPTQKDLAWLAAAIGETTLLTDIDGAEIARVVAIRRGMRVVNVAREKARARQARGGKTRAPLKPARLVSPARVNRSVTELIRKVLRRAELAWDLPVRRINWKEHLLAEPDERVREASADEEARLFAAMPAQWHPILRFYLRQLVRQKTAVLLEFSQIDWGTRSFTFVGKGRKVKTLPLADDVRDELWALQAPGATRVFRYPNGQPMTVWGFASAFRRARAAAGIVDFRPHDLRHTGASRTLRRTNNLRLVQRLLTHKDIASTVKYAHVQDEDLRAALNLMAEPAAGHAVPAPAIATKAERA